MLEELRKEVISLAREVGEFMIAEQRKVKRNRFEFKGRNDLVSYVDKTVEEKLVEGLKKLLPNSAFIVEEETVKQEKQRFTWIIDPLDGTSNYLYGLPVFCTCIALMDGDEIVLGVVHDPVHNECFNAIKGGGAFINDTSIEVSPENDLTNSFIAMGFPYDTGGKLEKNLAILKKIIEETRGMRRLGSAALDMVYVACGRFDAFYEYNLSPWDVAAASIIVTEAGGKNSDFNGGKNYIFGKTICSSNKFLHQQMLDLIGDWD